MFGKKWLVGSVFLCCLFAAQSSQCPDVCYCSLRGNSLYWSCKQVVSLDQFGASANTVKHLHLQNSTLVFSRHFLDRFPELENLETLDSAVICDNAEIMRLDAKLLAVGNLKDVNCTSPPNIMGKSVLKVLELFEEVHSLCPKHCDCQLNHIPTDGLSGGIKYVTVRPDSSIIMDCSNRGLTEFPKLLPSNYTIHLYMSHNKIEYLNEVAVNPSYSKVNVLYLNNNQIKSLSALENSEWIRRFRLLDLQGNALQEISTEALANTFNHEDMSGHIRMYLGHNPWKCDCVTVSNFQTFMAKNTHLVKDASNMTCGPTEGEKAGQKIATVELSSVCWNPDASAINLMDVLNVILALLTVATIGKLLYDYYAYRKTGRLPWIVSKMP